MDNHVDSIATDIDQLDVGESMLVGDPSAFHLHKIGSNNSLKIIVQNIRSLNKNFHDFEILLNRSETQYDVIVLTECWLQNCPLIPDLQP